MSYTRVPAHLRGLTLAQANAWGNVYDAAILRGLSKEDAARAAWGAVRRADAKPLAHVPKYPHTIEARYESQLLRRALTVHRATMLALRAHLDDAPAPSSDAAKAKRADAVGDLGLVLRILEGVRAVFAGTFAPKPGDVAPLGRQADLFATDQLRRALSVPRVGIPVSSRDTLDTWTRDNVALIKTIDARYFDSVAEVLEDGYRAGTPTREITREIASRYGVAQSDARRIARTEIAKLNGAITKEKHVRLGIKEYTWSTSGDERVRPDHRRLNRSRNKWSDPPVSNRKTGARNHPGGDIQCRCVAVPILPDDFDGIPAARVPRYTGGR